MTQQSQETPVDIEQDLDTDSQMPDPQDQQEQIPVEEETAEPEAVSESEAPVDPADPDESEEAEVPEPIEVEFSTDGIGEDEPTEEEAEPQDAEGSEEASDAAEPADGGEPQNDSEEDSPTVESVIEAILFASDEPLTDAKLAGIVETTAKQVRDCIEALNAKYAEHHNAFRIEQIAGGNQMLTMSVYNNWLKKMLRVRSDNKLSPAAMETLAIVAYKQPVIRADIEAIRGVAVGEVIRSLMYKGLVKIVGRAEILGRPMLYGTTKKFLEVFGLNSIKDLPKAEELKKPD